MSRVLAIVNVKGGVGKTTTTANLAAALTRRGRKVLAVDLDPQASLSFSLGLRPDQFALTIRNALDCDALPLSSIIQTTNEGFDLAPSNHGLNDITLSLEETRQRMFALRAALEPIREHYDYVLLDCPANAGVFTGVGLVAADQAVIPLLPDFLALKTLDWLLFLINEIKDAANPTLRVAGCFLMMYDPRTRHARNVLATLHNDYGATVPLFTTRIKYSVRLKDASASGQSILSMAPDSDIAESFRALALEIDEGIRLGPENELFFVMMEGQDAAAGGDLPSAYASFCRATEINPRQADAWRGRAESAPNWGEALRSYTRALQLDPSNPDMIAGLERRLDEALTQSELKDVNEILNQAHCFAEAGLASYALALYRRASELNPKNQEAWIGCSRTTGDQREAVSFALQALSINSGNPRAQAAAKEANERVKTESNRLVQEGQALFKQGDKEQAYKLFVEAVDLDPQSEQGWLGCAQTTDDLKAAFGFVKHVLRINSKNPEALELYQTLWRPDSPGADKVERDPTAPRNPIVSILLALIVIVVLVAAIVMFLSR